MLRIYDNPNGSKTIYAVMSDGEYAVARVWMNPFVVEFNEHELACCGVTRQEVEAATH